MDDPITEASALTIALNELDAISYRWEDTMEEAAVKEMFDDPTLTNYPEGELLIAELRNGDLIEHKLAWKFSITGDYWLPDLVVDTLEDSLVTKSFSVYIDATNGNILRVVDDVNHGTYNTASGQTYYDGWQSNFRTWECDVCSQWRLRADRGDRIATTTTMNDPFNQMRFQGPLDNDNVWAATSEKVLGSVSAHWSIQRAWEFFNTKYGYSGSDNKGHPVGVHSQRDPSAVENYALYRPTNKNYDEIWVGRFINGVSPADIDVLGHEYTHAFISHSSELNKTFNHHEAGALNEGLADIFGLAIKMWQRGGTNPWAVAEEVNFPGGMVRRFDDPHSSWTSHSPQPAKYMESGYWSGSSYHIDAGVLTHWFYLFANGGTYNGVTVNGVGLETATDVCWVTMTWWMWHDIMYAKTRSQMISVIIKHFGGRCSPVYKAAIDAWAAVGFGTTVCSPYNFDADLFAVGVSDLNDQEKQPKFNVVYTGSGEASTTLSYDWLLPSNWEGTVSNNDATFTLENANEDYSSQEIAAVVTYRTPAGDTLTDTLKTVLHIVDDNLGQKGNNNDKFQPDGKLDLVSNKQVTIYPNPNSTKNITIDLPSNTFATLEINSITGVKYKRLILDNASNTISLEDLSSGIYIFRVRNNVYNVVERVVVK